MNDIQQWYLFPEFEYDKLQLKRFKFCHGRVERFRKTINDADKELEPNMIAVVYIAGYSKYIYNYVQKTKGNVVVLCANIPPELFEAHDTYWRCVEEYRNAGFINQDGTFNEMWEYHVEKFKDFEESPEEMENIARTLKAIEDYEALKEKIPELFSQFIMCDKLHPEQIVQRDCLDWIVKEYFPYGLEAFGCSKSAILIANVKRATTYGITHKEYPNMFGLPKEVLPSERFKPAYEQCFNIIENKLNEDGNVNLLDVYIEMRSKPYGWGGDCQAGYCFGQALSRYLGGNYYVFDGFNSWAFDENVALTCVTNIFSADKGISRRHLRWEPLLYRDEAQELTKRFAYIFDMPEINPFDTFIVRCVSDIENTKRITIPLAIIDEDIPKVFRRDTFYNVKSTSDVNRLLEHFTWERCKEIKDRLNGFEAYVLQMIWEKYPDKVVDYEEILRFCTTACSGWLWDADTFWRCVKGVVTGEWEVPNYNNVVAFWRERKK